MPDLDKYTAEILDLANVLHKAVPAGTSGNTVLAALSILLGAGINHAPPDQRDELSKLCIEAIQEIVDGDIGLAWVPD